MFMLDLIGWWYGSGWKGILSATRRRLSGLAQTFSISTLLSTLFAPWKRIITYPGMGLDGRLRAFGDNFISRCVGFVVRLFVLLAAAVSFVGLCVAGVLEIIVWPLLPLLGMGLLVWGLI
ncbi:MAG TPA: hypothetical protein VGM08_03885 [Candidatus Saccharimonadales bacterium]|jgi:hypothetical protein